MPNSDSTVLAPYPGGRTIGLIQGPALPTSRLRYRLRSIERLDSSDRPFVTLALTHADQVTRRAIRSLGDPTEHRRTFVATEGELLAGDHKGVVWPQCGSGLGDDPPVRVSPDASLAGILGMGGAPVGLVLCGSGCEHEPQSVGIAPFMVVGRLQKEKRVGYNQLTFLKERYEWGGEEPR